MRLSTKSPGYRCRRPRCGAAAGLRSAVERHRRELPGHATPLGAIAGHSDIGVDAVMAISLGSDRGAEMPRVIGPGHRATPACTQRVLEVTRRRAPVASAMPGRPAGQEAPWPGPVHEHACRLHIITARHSCRSIERFMSTPPRLRRACRLGRPSAHDFEVVYRIDIIDGAPSRE